MSRWLLFLIVLAWASGVREGPEEFTSEVAIVSLTFWYWMKLRRIAEMPMKVYPFDEVVARVTEILEGTSTNDRFLTLRALVGSNAKVEVYQQFNCDACGTKQTMPDPNVLYTHGKCEECGAVTNIKRRGCNYAVHYMGRGGMPVQ